MWTSLFAETIGSETQGWVAIIVQTGAIGILGYHLLKGLPSMLDSMMDKTIKMVERITTENSKIVADLMQSFRTTLGEDRKLAMERETNNRTEFSARNQSIVSELHEIGKAIPPDIGKKVDLMASDLATQTGALGVQTMLMEKQTAVMEDVGKKLKEWPSDVDKICKFERLMREAGVEPETVKKWGAMQRRLRDKREKEKGKDQ